MDLYRSARTEYQTRCVPLAIASCIVKVFIVLQAILALDDRELRISIRMLVKEQLEVKHR
jgi:hypothetical protein